jgi:hypothetical protein
LETKSKIHFIIFLEEIKKGGIIIMKTKNLKKRLALNKETVANLVTDLDKEELKNIKGGSILGCALVSILMSCNSCNCQTDETTTVT